MELPATTTLHFTGALKEAFASSPEPLNPESDFQRQLYSIFTSYGDTAVSAGFIVTKGDLDKGLHRGVQVHFGQEAIPFIEGNGFDVQVMEQDEEAGTVQISFGIQNENGSGYFVREYSGEEARLAYDLAQFPSYQAALKEDGPLFGLEELEEFINDHADLTNVKKISVVRHAIRTPLTSMGMDKYIAGRSPIDQLTYNAMKLELRFRQLLYYTQLAERFAGNKTLTRQDVLNFINAHVDETNSLHIVTENTDPHKREFPDRWIEIFNLVDNAKAKGKGDSTFTTIDLSKADSKSSMPRVSVLDNGRGIAPTDLTKVFTKGYSTGEIPNGGNGMNLLLEKLAEKNGFLVITSFSRKEEGGFGIYQARVTLQHTSNEGANDDSRVVIEIMPPNEMHETSSFFINNYYKTSAIRIDSGRKNEQGDVVYTEYPVDSGTCVSVYFEGPITSSVKEMEHKQASV